MKPLYRGVRRYSPVCLGAQETLVRSPALAPSCAIPAGSCRQALVCVLIAVRPSLAYPPAIAAWCVHSLRAAVQKQGASSRRGLSASRPKA